MRQAKETVKVECPLYSLITAIETMDKKSKKKLEVLRAKLLLAEQKLAGARKQMDDEAETQQLEAEVLTIKQQIEKLKSG